MPQRVFSLRLALQTEGSQFRLTKDGECLLRVIFQEREFAQVKMRANGVRRYRERLLIQYPSLCQLMIGNQKKCKAHADFCRQRVARESLLLSGNGRGQLAKKGEHERRSVQNIRVIWVEHHGLIEVCLRPDKVEQVTGTHEAACGVGRG